MNGLLSTVLSDLADSIGNSLTIGATVAPGPVYSALVKARDEAVVLEARAGERDARVHALIASIDGECERLGNHAAGAAAASLLSCEGSLQ